MLDYFIQVLLFQTLFLIVYDFLLRKETFFQWNRLYLIGTTVLAYLIPLIKIEEVSQVVPQEYTILLPEVILSPQSVLKEQFDWTTFLLTSLNFIFWIGVVLASILFLVKLFKVIQLVRLNEKEQMEAYRLVYLNDQSPFSFFNYIFLNKKLPEKAKRQIIEHELVHVQQKHSLDLLFFELQRIVCWFNPFSYLYQRRMAELHEYIADARSVKKIAKADYFENLLHQTFGIQKISFINPFFKHSLIKKRIVMLNKNKSKGVLKFKYILLLPLLTGMLLYSSCEKNEGGIMAKNEKRLITLYAKSPDNSEIKQIKSKKEGYFDLYMFGAKPEGVEIKYNKLSKEEKTEFDKISKADTENKKFYSFKIFQMDDGTKAIEQTIDWQGMKASWNTKDYSNADVVPFVRIDKAPVFPGCENTGNAKQCFAQKVKEYVNKNFNIALVKTLPLEKGKKKIYVQFTIDKNGVVSEVRARAPHIDLEDEAMRVIHALPIMEPAVHNNKKVAVKYTLPITVMVD